MKNPRKKVLPFGLMVIIVFSVIAGLDISRKVLLGEFTTDVIEFEMLYSSEKGGWLEEISPIFEEEYFQKYNEKIRMILNPIGSGKGTIQVARGISEPVVWSPASRFWLPILNFLWASSSKLPIVQGDAPALVVSPTVIATWKSYQEEHNITSFNDLHELSLNNDEFTYAHTDPSRSNSGFGAVIMQVATALGKTPEEITLEDLADEDVYKWMTEIESAAVEYGSSTGFLAKLFLNGGPSRLKVAILYENLIVEKNKGIAEYGYNDSLVAIYPIEGTVLNDHPYAILDAPWVDDKEIEIAEIFLEFLKREDIQAKAIKLGFRPSINMTDLTIEEGVFNETVGVLPSIKDIAIYDIGNIDGEVLQRISDLWIATRSTDGSNSGTGLNNTDLVVPSILLGLMLLMILFPIYTLVRNIDFRRFRK